MKPQYAEQRSLRDVRRGIALLGVADASLAGRRFSVEGMRVEAVAFRGLALLLRPLRGDELRHVGDQAWVEREGRLQVRLCDRLSAKSSLLPAKTGTVFASSADLQSAAEQAYRRWRRALGRLAGKQEWIILGYIGPHPARPHGGAAVLGKSLTGRRAVAAEPFRSLWEALAPAAQHARLVAPRDPRASFAAAFLVPIEGAGAFLAALQRAASGGVGTGVTIYHAGPRAPYHFAS